jgi:hypothetical protein
MMSIFLAANAMTIFSGVSAISTQIDSATFVNYVCHVNI